MINRTPLAHRIPLLALALAALLAPSCTRTVVTGAIDTNYPPNDATAQLDYWHGLPGRSAVTNDEGFHGMLLLFEEADETGSYEGRVARLKELQWLGEDFDEPAELAVQRGTLAHILVRAMEIDGGVMMWLTGKNARYATKELQFLGIMPYGDEYMVIDGLDYLGMVSKAQDFLIARGQREAQDVRELDDIEDPAAEAAAEASDAG